MTAPHILVVDDEPDIRELVKEILEDESYEVSVAADGAACMREAVRVTRPEGHLLVAERRRPYADIRDLYAVLVQYVPRG